MTFDECCDAVLREQKDPYAKAYARAGYGMTGEAARVQALYIRNNLASWRGPRAREVKAELDRIGKRSK